MQTVYPEVVHPRPDKNDKLWSIVCHLSGWFGVGFILLPLIVYLVMRKESHYAASHSREALNFHLSIILYMILCLPLAIIGIGALLAVGFWFFSLIMGIVAAVKASDGTIYKYPLTIRFVR